jgi:hypothetical protein
VDAALATVLAAIVTATGVVLSALINKFRRENQKDHGQVMTVLGAMTRIMSSHSHEIEKVGEKVDSLREDLNTHTH